MSLKERQQLEKYKKYFKPIRKKIAQFEKKSAIEFILGDLNKELTPSMETLSKKPPWFGHLIIKWFILHGATSNTRKPFEYSDYVELINLTHKLSSYAKMPTDFSDLRVFMKSMAHQQFHLQQSLNLEQYARQCLIFEELPDNHTIKKWFEEANGLTINEFIHVSVVITLVMMREEYGAFKPSLFYQLLAPELVEKFLKATSYTVKDLSEILKGDDDKRFTHIDEMYEVTPFYHCPLVRFDDRYYPLSKQLFFRAMENFIYDSLKKYKSGDFVSKFGNYFEKYVGTGVERYTSDFYTESRLKEILPVGSNVVDFLIFGEKANIFIDAKGIELNPEAKKSTTGKIIDSQTKNSLGKAIVQGFNTKKGFEEHGGDKVKGENFLLVVTYRELYLGNGADLYQSFSKRSIDSMVEKQCGGVHIPFENVYFCSVDEFDNIIQYLVQTNTTLDDFLMEFKELNRTSARMMLNQLIQSKDIKLKRSPHLDEYADSLIQRFKPNERK